MSGWFLSDDERDFLTLVPLVLIVLFTLPSYPHGRGNGIPEGTGADRHGAKGSGVLSLVISFLTFTFF